MRIRELDTYLNNPELVQEKISEFIKEGNIRVQKLDKNELEGHLLKSERNLRFIYDNMKLGYHDWAICGCYYAAYHAALALMLTKEYSSKSHLATLLLLIKEFYDNGLNSEDLHALATLLNYEDILFYVESKQKREDATYSTNTKYTKQDVEMLRVKTTVFVSKVKEILKKS